MKNKNNTAVAAAAGVAASYFFSKQPKEGTTEKVPLSAEEKAATGSILNDPQIERFFKTNPPPTGGTTQQRAQWKNTLNILVKDIIAPALGNIKLPEGTPDILEKVYQGVIEAAGDGFTKSDLTNWWSSNSGDVFTTAKSYLSGIFSSTPDPL